MPHRAIHPVLAIQDDLGILDNQNYLPSPKIFQSDQMAYREEAGGLLVHLFWTTNRLACVWARFSEQLELSLLARSGVIQFNACFPSC